MNSETIQRVVVTGSSRLRGDFSLPGDKSISHRSALFAALGEGRSEIRNYSTAQDCQSTLDCLEALGVEIKRSPSLVTVEGVGLEGLRESEVMLDAGNSGSTIRMLSGILAGQPFTTRITGDESIQRRPMKRVIDPLTLMGAGIEAREGNFAPLSISGGRLRQSTTPHLSPVRRSSHVYCWQDSSPMGRRSSVRRCQPGTIRR